MHAASGLLSWTMEILAFASRQFEPKTMDLSVRFIHSHFVQFFLVSEALVQHLNMIHLVAMSTDSLIGKYVGSRISTDSLMGKYIGFSIVRTSLNYIRYTMYVLSALPFYIYQ